MPDISQKNSQPLTVLLCADKNYEEPLTATLASILLKHPPSQPIQVILGTLRENPIRLDVILSNLRNFHFNASLISQIEVLAIDIGDQAQIPKNSHFTKAIFLRLELLEILAPRFHRLIYLDTDVLVRGSLSDIWQSAFVDALGVVADIREASLLRRSGFELIDSALPLRPMNRYFNSGMLIINLRHWTENGHLQKCRQLMTNNAFHYPDQDALNILYRDSAQFFESKWNWQTVSRILGYFKSHFPAPKDVLVVHFVDAPKPWVLRTRGFFVNEYQAIFLQCGFSLWPTKMTDSNGFFPEMKLFRAGIIIECLHFREKCMLKKQRIRSVILTGLLLLLGSKKAIKNPSLTWLMPR